MLREIRDLGFESAELSHGIRISLLPGILEAVDAGEITISSVHNFCPLPMGIDRAAPNVFKFSSDNPRERENAFKHTLRTMEMALRVRAGLVVLHMGAMEMKDYTDKLVEMAKRGKRDTPKYARLCEEVSLKQEAKKEPFVLRAYEMLHRLVAEAEARGLKLGIENREALEEIPLDSDFLFFFKEFTSPAVVYWHDTGHAQIKENIGFIHHGLHLESLREHLFGFHIHDVQFPGRDHCAPGTGMIDFAGLAHLVQPHHLKVFELSPNLSPEAVRKGADHIRAIWGPA
jgi:sugar phosphate isomerase/epimerase